MLDFSKLLTIARDTIHAEKVSILDLGSGDVNEKMRLVLVESKRQFKYTPVDQRTACSIFYRNPDESNQCTDDISMADWVEKLNRDILYDERIQSNPLSEAEFNETFSLNFGKDVFQFCQENLNGGKFDLIILSNLLHFLERGVADNLFSMCISMLKKQGLISVTVLSNEQASYPRDNLYSEEDFSKMKKGLTIISEFSNSSYFEFVGRIG